MPQLHPDRSLTLVEALQSTDAELWSTGSEDADLTDNWTENMPQEEKEETQLGRLSALSLRIFFVVSLKSFDSKAIHVFGPMALRLFPRSLIVVPPKGPPSLR
jgi:hypothetical protein